jgi:hypothetical protein
MTQRSLTITVPTVATDTSVSTATATGASIRASQHLRCFISQL